MVMFGCKIKNLLNKKIDTEVLKEGLRKSELMGIVIQELLRHLVMRL